MPVRFLALLTLGQAWLVACAPDDPPNPPVTCGAFVNLSVDHCGALTQKLEADFGTLCDTEVDDGRSTCYCSGTTSTAEPPCATRCADVGLEVGDACTCGCLGVY